MTEEHSPTRDEPEQAIAGTAIDTSVPHSARIWNYWLGGKDNYEVDRLAGDQFSEIYPGIVDMARGRPRVSSAVSSGTWPERPASASSWTSARGCRRRTTPIRSRSVSRRRSRIVYVDNDPLVLAHARALLTSSPEGVCEYLDADIRNPDAILDTAAGLLDSKQPIALMLMGIMGHFTDDEAYPIVGRLQAGLPSGSYFALYDGADTNEAFNQAQQGYNDSGAVPYYLRSPARFTPFFEGLELVEPGLVPVPHWRPDPGAEPVEIYSYCGVGRKP